MKIAFLADIHANYPALMAVLKEVEEWRPDQIWIAGDVINRGKYPIECMEMVLEGQRNKGWMVIRGNHEDYILQYLANPIGYQSEHIHQHTAWTAAQVSSLTSDIESLPEKLEQHLDAFGTLRMLHASMQHNRDGIFPTYSDEQITRRIQPAPAVYVTGHTHTAFQRQVGQTLVINAGSVGLPFDGDWRPGFVQAVIDGDQIDARIRRVEYDQGKYLEEITSSEYLGQIGHLGRIMHFEQLHARSHLAQFVSQYEAQVQSGNMSMRQAVDDYLQWQG